MFELQGLPRTLWQGLPLRVHDLADGRATTVATTRAEKSRMLCQTAPPSVGHRAILAADGECKLSADSMGLFVS